MGSGVGWRHGLDLAWLWLWHRPAAVAPIQPLAQEGPCAMAAAIKKNCEVSSRRGSVVNESD